MPTRSNLGAKDYELIASVLHDSDVINAFQQRSLALDFADRLVSTSDSFDPVRFVNQAVPGGGYSADDVSDWTTALRLRIKALEARRGGRA